MNRSTASSRAAQPCAARPDTEPEYSLPSHVRMCLTGNHVVFLDLRRDRYLALGPAQRRIFEATVLGRHSDDSAPASQDSRTLLDQLIAQDLLTSKAGAIATVTIEPVTEILVDDEAAREDSISARDVRRFALACARAALALRLRTLERVVDAVRRRKERALADGEKSTLQRDRALVATFNRLRPFALTANTHCLYDSLALLEFLAMHGSFPSWVIGVHTSPFAAHSWLQQLGYLFNGPIDQVPWYTPILVV